MVITGLLSLPFCPGFELPKPGWNAPRSTAGGYSSARMSSPLLSHSSPYSKSICNCIFKRIQGIKILMMHSIVRAWFSRVPKLQAHPNLLQPQWNKVFSCPPLNSVKRKPLVQLLAALLAEYGRREAVRAPPLERCRLATLAYSRFRDAFRVKEAV